MDAVLQHLRDENERLEQALAAKDQDLAAKDQDLAAKDEELSALRQRMKLLERALFGPRSERVVGTEEEQAEFEELLKQLEVLDEEVNPAPPAEEPSPKTKRKKKPPRNLEDLIPDDLPVKEVIIDIPEEDRIDLETGKPLVRIGEDVTYKLAYQPAHHLLIKYVRYKYAAPEHPEQGVQQAPMPELPIPRSDFDVSFLAGIVMQKVAMHLPLYRIEEQLRYRGIQISRQTLSRLYIQTAEALRPLYDELKAIVLANHIVFTDDTSVQMQMKGKGKTHTARMWVYCRGGPGPRLRIFEFTLDKTKRRPLEFLGDFKGHVHADAAAGYAELFKKESVHECACWMHVRRKFYEAEDAPPELREEILRHIRHIYLYERFIAKKTKAMDMDRAAADAFTLELRKQRIAPLIDRIFERCNKAIADVEVLPKSNFASAIGYLMNRGAALKTFLQNPHLSPDNGESERALRPLTIGRKNWLFVGNEGGGDATGILLSLVQNCRLLGIDPFTYLADVLHRIKSTPADALPDLLPHRWAPAT